MKRRKAPKHYEESSDIFHIKFGGENEIDALTFSKIMQDVIEISREVASSLEPDAFVKINIKATGTGSFESTLDAIITYAPTIFNHDNIKVAKELTNGILTIIKIKQHLKGDKPKNTTEDAGRTIITNCQNEQLSVDSKVGNVYLENSKIDNLTVNIFQTLSNDKGRSDFEIRTSDEKLLIPKSQYPEMVEKVIETDRAMMPQEQIISVNLLLKKPDLLGDSKWEFIFNKRILAKIDDKDFLKKVHKGKIRNLYAGVKIPCKLLIEYDLDEKYEPIVETESYTVLEITGEIIEPIIDEDLFD